MSRGFGRIQVISVVFEPLYPMVERGQFLEPLFYRLNAVSLEPEMH
jgi:transcriptional regulator of acetoin/glycerol metabolism